MSRNVPFFLYIIFALKKIRYTFDLVDVRVKLKLQICIVFLLIVRSDFDKISWHLKTFCTVSLINMLHLLYLRRWNQFMRTNTDLGNRI